MRVKEFNRQYQILPYPGLIEIIQKKSNFDNLEKVAQSNNSVSVTANDNSNIEKKKVDGTEDNSVL
jgi:hypothetical protein